MHLFGKAAVVFEEEDPKSFYNLAQFKFYEAGISLLRTNSRIKLPMVRPFKAATP